MESDLLVWHDERALKVGGVAVSSIGFWLTSDLEKDLPTSFSLLVNARVCGLQVGSVSVPVKDGSTFTMPLLEKIGGTVEGRIDNWGALDNTRKTVDENVDQHWKTANEVTFTITGIADVTLPAGAISTLLPGLGGCRR